MLAVLAATAIMLPIHAAGSYLGFRGRTIPRDVGVHVSLYESAYYIYMTYLLHGTSWLPLLAILMLIHVLGAYLYLKGYLGIYADRRTLRYYGVYEIFEFAVLCGILAYVA